MASDHNEGWPSEEGAREYLQKHKILELFEELSAHLLYRQPANPKEFMIEHIEKIKAARLTKKDFPHLFDRTNLQAAVRVVDPLGKGFFTTEQYRDAMETLGIRNYNQQPSTAANGKVSTEQFLYEAEHCLARSLKDCAMRDS